MSWLPAVGPAATVAPPYWVASACEYAVSRIPALVARLGHRGRAGQAGCGGGLEWGPAASRPYNRVANSIRRSNVMVAGAVALGEALRNQSTVTTLEFEQLEPQRPWFALTGPLLPHQPNWQRHGGRDNGCSGGEADEQH